MEALNGLVYLIAATGIGYAAADKLLPKSAPDVLPPLLFNICYPAMILDTFLTVDLDTLLGSGLSVTLWTMGITLGLLLLGLLLFRKLPEGRRKLAIFLAGIGNVTYIALPLFNALLPAEAVLTAIIHSTAQDPLIWSVYHPLILERTGERRSFKKLLSSPCLLAVILGAYLCISGIPVPSAVSHTLSRISAACSPVSLLLIGILIRQHGILSWWKDRGALLYGLLKVIVLPLCLYPLLHFFLPRQTALLLSILFGSPAPLLSVAWAKQHHKEEAFAVHCFLFSTLLYLAIASILLPALLQAGIL